MHPIVRVIVGVVTGILASFVIVAVIEACSVFFFPLPPGTDISNPESMRAAMRSIPPAAMALVIVAWALGAFVGTYLAARIARGAMYGMIVGALLLTSAVMNMLSFPHPMWFWVASIALCLVAIWLGTTRGAPGAALPPAAPAHA